MFYRLQASSHKRYAKSPCGDLFASDRAAAIEAIAWKKFPRKARESLWGFNPYVGACLQAIKHHKTHRKRKNKLDTKQKKGPKRAFLI